MDDQGPCEACNADGRELSHYDWTDQAVCDPCYLSLEEEYYRRKNGDRD